METRSRGLGVLAGVASRFSPMVALRNFAAATPVVRGFVAVLLLVIVLAQTTLAMLFFDSGPLHAATSPTSRALAILMTVAGSGIAAATLAGVLETSDSLAGAPARVMSAVVRLLPGMGLILVGVTIISMFEVSRVSSAPEWIAIRAVLWAGLGLSCLYVLRPPSPRLVGVFDLDRTARVALPLMVIAIALALVVVSRQPVKVIANLLVPSSSFVGLVGYPIMLGLLSAASIQGLSVVRERGERLSNYVGVRHKFVVALLVGKLIVLLSFCAALHYAGSDSSPLSWTLTTWMCALSAAAVVIFLFVVDDRISVSTAEYTVVARNAAWLIPGFVGFAFVTAIVVALAFGFALGRPFALIAAVVIVALALLPRWVSMGRPWRIAHRAATMAAVLGAIVVGSLPPLFTPIYTGGDKATGVLLAIGVLVGMVASAIGFVWLLIRTLRRRRFGVVTYLITVAIWIVLLTVWNALAAPVRWTQFDIALTALLALLACASLVGFRHAVGPVEMVIAATVTFFLIEYAGLSQFLPRSIQVLPLMFAVLGPGIVTVWTSLRTLSNAAEQRTAIVKLATTALVYQQLAAIAWSNASVSIPEALDAVSDLTLGFISIPLILLLIAAREPTRDRQRPGSALGIESGAKAAQT